MVFGVTSPFVVKAALPLAFLTFAHLRVHLVDALTGALKTGLRDWLKTAPGVKKWRRGDQSEGGDAFTVVELR